MIQITKQPSSLCFIGNPIVYEAEVDSTDVELTISVADNQKKLDLIPYQVKDSSRVRNVITVNVSDIIQALIPEKAYLLQDTQMIEVVKDFSTPCQLFFSDKLTYAQYQITAFRGGISQQLLRDLNVIDKDLFSYRLNNPYQQFLFTTRTHSSHLIINEDELFPFIFIYPQGNLSFIDSQGNTVYPKAQAAGQVCALSITAIRKQFLQSFGQNPYFIQVYVNKILSFDITILPSKVTEEKYKIKFRNSLGAYELISALGKAKDKSEFSEESLYQVVNENMSFDELRERLTRRDELSLEIGYKSKDDLHFVKDLIASEEIYLLEKNGYVRCHITVDEFSIDRKMVKPTSISLILKLINDEKYYSPTLIDLKPEPEPKPEIKLPEYDKPQIETRYFEIRPSSAVLEKDAISFQNGGLGALSFTPVCNRDWDDPNGIPTSPASWTEGGNTQETLKVRKIGEYYWSIENFKLEYSPTGSLAQYILKQSQLDNAGIPLTVAENNEKTGAFIYGASPSNIYLEQLKAYPTRTLPIGVNPNLWGKSNIKNIIPNTVGNNIGYKLIEDPNWSTIILPHRLFTSGEVASDIYRSITVWREDPANSILRITKSYGAFSNLSADYSGGVYDITDHSQTYTLGMGGYTPTYWLVSIKTNGRSFEELPKIKIEYGSSYTGWANCIDGTEEKGWALPDKADFLQLFGMIGEDLSYSNLRKNLFVRPIDKEIPWINNYPASEQCEDLLGSRFLPIGMKNNGNIPGVSGQDGEIYNYGQKISFMTKSVAKNTYSSSSPALWITEIANNGITTKVCWDIYGETTSGENSAQYWQKNVRLCRPITDQELGYKLWIDETNDQIVVTSLAQAQPTNTRELEKGLLRGLAVRWMNEDKTKVIAPLSKLQAEVDKTKNGGEYEWFGFFE